ncbi:retinaldehyde-binding protein 1 [Nephila pilipes]|uniref:Retinaldehyde-binding protein 1 n=1 Tax=Nephila pilipes TaxID=299642 RepID=A0A8X6Q1B6_NEPPI|nr:retinaldehyde-binding protein 1 [Nephila pilipes]
MATVHLLSHFVLSFPISQVNGICFISDTSLPSLEALQLMFKYVKTFAPSMNNFPARIKRIDCINVNILFRAAYSIIQTFVPAKIFQRVKLHGNSQDTLIKHYPSSILPKEFGGSFGTFKDLHKDWIDDLKKYITKYEADNSYYNY